MSPVVRQPHAGPDWSELAALDRCAAVLDPGDRVGAKNALIDQVHKRVLGRELAPLRGRRIVDFGCGTGRLAEWLADAGAVVSGVDVTREMLDQARAAVPDVAFFEIDGFALPFDGGSQDAVVSVYVLQYYVADADAMAALLTEFRRVLRPGGVLALIEQVTDGDIGRGASAAAYREWLASDGWDDVRSRPVRVGDSWFMRAVERRPRLGSLAALPSLVVREASRVRPGALAGDRYADTLFLARAPG